VLCLEFGAFTNMEKLIEQHCNNKDYNCVFFQRGFIDSMNKIFKVVWSKTKECYVVVSEVAKNNSGKKKVLASVLAALAVVGAGATGTPVQAAQDLNKKVNISPTGTMGGGYPNTNSVSDNSIVVGYGNTTTGAAGYGHVAYGFGNTATEDTTTAIGGGNKATGGAATAVGSFNTASGRASVAIGNVSIASAEDSIAIGNRANADANNHDADRGSGQYSIAVGRESWAKGTDNISIGHKAETNSTGDSIAMGRESKANQANAIAVGPQADANGWGGIAMGREAAISANYATAIGYKANASGSNSISVGRENTAKAFDAVAIGHNNTSRTYSAVSLGTDNTSDATYGLTDAQVAALPYDPTSTATLTDPRKTDPRRGITSTIAIGRNNVAGNVETIAIGTNTKATMTDAIAIGSRAEATGDYALAIGGAAGGYKVAAAGYGTAVGVRANAAERASAFGAGSNAGSQKSVAIGYTAKASAQKATSNYEFSGSNGTLSPAGYNTETITVNSASVPNTGAVAGNYYDAGSAVAIGDGATVSDESDRAVVVGAGAKTNGNAHYSVVLGSGSHADASDGFVAGHGSFVESRESIAMGSAAHVSGNENIRSQAIGYGATVSGTGAYDATAIGATAQVSGVQGGVALGAGSLLSRTTNSNENAGFNSKFVDGTKVRNRAYTADLTGHNDQWDSGSINTGAVSVGNDTQKRQIINVAAGNQDTDAVNVAQLKNVGVRVGADTNTATIGTDKVAADFLAYNGQLNIKGDNNRVTTVSENDANGKDANVNVKFDYDGLVKAKTGSAVTVDQKTDGNGKTYFEIDAAAGSKTVVADGKNTTVTGAGTTASPYKVNVEGALTGISSITNNGGGKIEFTTSGTTISGGPVNVSNNKITGVANGDVNATSTDAVNGSQLHAVKTAERHIAPTTAGHEYTVDSNGDVTMTYLDGNNNAVANEKAVIKGIAKQDLSNINDAGKKVITGLGTIVKAGDNVNVSESSDATTGQKTYTVNAVTPAVYTKADGTKVYKRPDGTFTTNSNLAAGNNVDKGDVITSFMDGNGNTTGGNMVINNVGSAIKNAGNAGDSFLTKLDAANTATPNAAVNVSDLKNTADGLTDKGLKFDANEGGVKTNKLGSTVTVKGTGALSAGKAYADEYNTANIRTNIEQGSDGNTTINVGLAKELKGINSISNGNSSITLNSNPGGTNNTPAVQITGGNLSMGNGTTNNKIVNLAPGTADTDAVNVKQLKDTELHITPGTYTPGTDKKVKLTYTDGNGGVVSGKEAVIDLSGLSTGGTSSTEKVKKAANGANDTNIAEVNPQTGDTYGAADATYEVSVSRNAVKDAAREAVTVNNGGTTTSGTYTADANNPISVTATPDNTNHNTTYAVTFDGNKAAKQIPLTYKATNGTTTSAEQTVKLDKGLNFTGGDYTTASVGADGKVTFDVNLGTTPTVTDGKPGVPGQAGATGKDGIATVKTVVDTINNSGWKANAKANGGKLDGTATATVVKPGNTVNYAAGKNLIVNQELEKDASNALTGNQTYTYSLNKDIDLTNAGSLTVGDTTVNNGGITIKAPTPAAGATATTDVKLTNTGLDNGGNKIVNVKDGDVSATSTDAVNGSQLHAVKAAERHIKPDTYAVDGNGKVTMKYVDGDNQDVTGEAVITGIAKQDLSNINNAGKNVITGLGTIVKAGDNVNVSESSDATTGQKTYTVNAVTPAVYTTPDGTKLTKDKDGKFHKEGETAEYTGDIITSFENPKAATGQTTKDGGMIVNNIGSAIKNQTPTMPAGQTATYLDKLKAAADDTKTQNAAVNVSDLHNTANALKDSELHIAPTAVKSGSTEAKGGVVSGNTNPGAAAQAYKYNATTKQVELTFNDGNGKAVTGPKAVIDLSELAGSIQNYGFQTNADGNLKDGTTATATAVASGKTVTYAAGKNLTVEQEIAANGNQTYTYALNKDLTNLDKVVVNGKDGIDGKDGVSITGPKGESAPGAKDGQDGKVGIAGKDGKDAVSISGKDGVGHIGLQGPKGTPGTPGADGASLDISTDHGTQTLVKPEANNDNKSERIVYVPKDKDGNPLKDTDGNVIKREVATMDDGLKFAGDDGTVIKKALGTQLDIVGGATGALSDNNIGVNNDNGKLKVQLAKKIDLTDAGSVTTGNTKVNNDGITITNPTDSNKNVSLTGTGLNNGGNKITNVKAGENPTDAVNVQQLKDNVTTVESSDSSIKVVDKNAPGSATYDATKGHQYDITINNQSVVEHAQTPVVYTDKDGHKLYKIVDTAGNVTFNTKEDGTGTTVQPGDVIASMNNGGDSTTTPMKLNNVGSSIQDPNSTDTFLKQLEDANKNTPNGAVNVSDLKKTSDALIDKGLVFDANNADPKTNKLGSKVTIAGTGTLATGENFADKYNTSNIRTNITQDLTTGNTTVEIGLNKNLKGLESVSVPGKDGVDGKDGVSITGKDGANGVDGKVGIGKDGKDAVSISGKDGVGHIGLTGPAGKDGKNATADITVKEGQPGLNGTDGITRIVYQDKDGKDHEVATHDDGLKFTGNNVSTENKHKLNSVVKVQGEGVTEDATSGKLEVNGQEFKSAAGNIAVVADGDKTLTVKMNKDLNLTKDGSLTIGDTKVNNDGITITGGPSVTKTGINAGNKAITNVANGTNDSDAVNVSQLKGSITTVKSSDGSITVTDDNASTDPTKGHAYDIKVNSQGVVNNAQLPVVYTDKDGNKLYLVNGQFYKTKTPVPGTDQPVDTGDVIASMNNGGDSTTTPMKLNNVGSSIANETGATFLDKLDSAKTNTPNGAVNVTDLKSTADAIGEKGLNFGAQSGNDIHKNLGEKLEIVGGGTKTDDKYDASNIKTMTKDGKVVIALDKDLKADSVTVGEKGQPGVPGKNGMDGKIGVNGKDGSAVVINGKDGSIGLNGKDGANGITIKGDKGVDGVDGVNGTNGITRIVYQDKDGNNHEVATHDDGMKFAGDDGQTNQDTNPKVIKKHLNKVVDIVGGADKTKLTDNNIGVNNDGGKLRVQLANELSGINKISNGNSSISIADVPAGATTPAVTISGGNLSMGDNKITNVKAGTNDTDAVNYKQLKDSRTTVTSQDGSVTITPTQNGDSTNYDLKVNPPLDPRVDQLAEEIGRVGAQGAALAALKPIQYDPLEPTQIMAGYGNYRGNSAIAMGVAHYKNESTLIHGGVSWAGGSSHMMANAGVTWKVGNRDSEAAVADRYRKGPISSAYAMQQEMAAMKAQNAGLKGEVSDLKAENEQMKAQIAAMMAKLGL